MNSEYDVEMERQRKELAELAYHRLQTIVAAQATVADLRQRYAAFMADHLENDHMWDEYAYEGDGVEYMEAAHKAIHAEDEAEPRD